MSKHGSHRKEEETGAREKPPAEQDISQGQAVSGMEQPGESSAPVQEQAGQPQEAPAEQAAGMEAPPEQAGLEAQFAELQDQYLRKAAEFENFRKRMIREKQDAIDYANQSLILDLLPVIDDLDRALESAEASLGADNPVLEGIGLIEKRLLSVLENRWGLKRFDSAGELFDPNRHEAIMMEKSPEITEPLVKEDLIKGYTLKDRVIRAAKVKVEMPE
jgi:molecular chaperone GrpE